MLVSNTSTLILLAKVDALSILLDDVKTILIPNNVYQEIAAKDSLDVLLIKKEVDKKRILLFNVEKKEYSGIIAQFRLDEGEAAAYALLKQKKAAAILTDDAELIKLCKIEGAAFITAMSVIVRLFKYKKLTAEESLEKLENLRKHGWYSNEIYNFFKQKVK